MVLDYYHAFINTW